jgi:hypothetical protein
MLVRYFYAWTPLVVVGTVVLLSLPWLGLIALASAALAAFAALAALASAIVAAPLAVGHAIGHRWHGRSAAPQPSPALSLARAQARVARVSRASETGGLNKWKPLAWVATSFRHENTPHR